MSADVALLDDVLVDPDEVLERVRVAGGHWNQARYVPAGTGAAYAAGHPLARPAGAGAPPVFRSDWYRWGEARELGERLAGDQALSRAALRAFGGRHVVPTQVHVNVTIPGPTSDAGHVDVPVFRGLDRRNAPGWLLLALARSGVAERWRVRTATAVLWLHRGDGGGFTWWHRGPHEPPTTVTDLWNRAIVMDADRIHHRVEPVGPPGWAPVVGVDSTIEPDEQPGWWRLRGAGRVTRLDPHRVRVSISWKAAIFGDDADRDRYLGDDDPLDVEHALRLLRDEAVARGAPLDRRAVPDVRDATFVAAVEAAIPRVVPHPPTTSN